MAKRHKGDTKKFRELSFTEQAKSITAMINNLQAAIKHHVQHSPHPSETNEKCLGQVDRLEQRLRETYDLRLAPSEPDHPIVGVEEMPRLRVRSPRLAVPEHAADFEMEVVEEP